MVTNDPTRQALISSDVPLSFGEGASMEEANFCNGRIDAVLEDQKKGDERFVQVLTELMIFPGSGYSK